MSEHHSIVVRGTTIDFHVYVSMPNPLAKIRQLEPFFQRLPDAHLAVVYPIFVIERKPAGRVGGGTWPPGLVRSEFMGTAHSLNTGVPDADAELYAASLGKGIIALSRDRWERNMGFLEFSMFHEVGHSVDNQLGLVPAGAAERDFEGMRTDRCGSGNMMVRRAVEAYARYICRPSRVYHSPLASGDPHEINRRIIETLRRSPAFRTVPATWEPR